MRDPHRAIARALHRWSDTRPPEPMEAAHELPGLFEGEGWGFSWCDDPFTHQGETAVQAHAYVWPTGVMARGSRGDRLSQILEIVITCASWEARIFQCRLNASSRAGEE